MLRLRRYACSIARLVGFAIVCAGLAVLFALPELVVEAHLGDGHSRLIRVDRAPEGVLEHIKLRKFEGLRPRCSNEASRPFLIHFKVASSTQPKRPIEQGPQLVESEDS